MGIVVASILEGKLEDWKAWNAELKGARQSEFSSLNSRYGLTRHATWLAETPMGPVVVAQHEGPGADTFMPKLASSTDAFDILFASKIKEMHGMDVSAPPPGPMPVLYTDFGVSLGSMPQLDASNRLTPGLGPVAAARDLGLIYRYLHPSQVALLNCYCAVYPPSTIRGAPVTNDDSSDARKSAA